MRVVLAFNMKFDSLRFEDFLKLGGDFRIFARNDLRMAVNDVTLLPNRRNICPNSRPTYPPPRMIRCSGRAVNLHQVFIRQNLGGIETRNGRDVWPAARVDEDFFGFEKSIAHLNLVRIREFCVPLEEMHIRMQPDFLFYSAAIAVTTLFFCATIVGRSANTFSA